MDRSIVVPQGEAGLLFMRDFVRRNFRPKKPGGPSFVKGFAGFLSYEWEVHFVYVDEVIDVMSGRAAAAAGYFFQTEERGPLAASSPLALLGTAVASRGRSHHDARSASLKMFEKNILPQPQRIAAPVLNLTYSQYQEKIQRIKEYLYAGDTYQVNFSQKFEVPYAGSAFELYQKLTQINPSQFQFFFETPEFAVISNSPERLLRIVSETNLGRARRGREASTKEPERPRDWRLSAKPSLYIETRPIKGTMPRGRTPEEDFTNTQKLLVSEKDRAELAMIVDLERNDIGKLCIPGTVEVTENRTIEKYSHVIHTVANITGVLADQYDWYDALKALFPGGSVTGCPKKRTMEIIAELEGEPRGVYCGSAGWIDLSGDCDFNIMIRTLWLEKGKNSNILSFRSGGGIIVDSDPQKEYEETLHKAAAIAQAIYEC